MVKIALKIKATTENVEELRPSGPGFRWYLKLVCSNCREESDKWNYLSLSETVAAPKGHGVSHYVSKCKLCSRGNSITILGDLVKPFVARDQDSFQSIVVFDCRGLEPCDFWPRDGWTVKSVDDGTEFTDVDLTEGEWGEYCQKIDKSIWIYGIEFRLEKIK
ncbi:CXXC motif containing zinc binding protein [Megalopta genalis]|uniref:CXXC motif containing zinc binding protein n=1 Tax=Megalopta genalis TaxID=115081 RepID=UPI001442FDA6|nr:CXXC motif containing zinc binding protein [Megalopta genalis]XP_033329281.1 CXXC motif containing zinc binding protein [Megalopta genalis]XP_033329282.1 CXXC motif containing zinc binding protein [Megalopta genalis]XP_033329283.1 CXXC motif containing zinc binding protein [Megalopta genalis]XP_033329284.1 CXXC motif containing zinc binding protein [Megalopta genalis]